MAKYKLDDLCEFITDGTHQTPEYCEEGGVIFLSSKDVTERKINWDDVKHIPDSLHEKLYKRLRPQKNDILLAKNGTTGVAAIVDRDEIFDIYVSLAVLRPIKSIYPKYLLYAINSPVAKRQFDAGLKGIGVPNLHLGVIRETVINVAEREEQELICETLDKVAGIIDKRKAELNALDDLIKARFVEMFGDVIHNSKKWQVCLFAEITSSRLGKMLDAKQQTGRNSYPYLANFNVQWFRFNLENLNKMDFDEKDRAEFELREGDLLVCEGGEIGRCAVWHNELQPCFFQKALHRVRCNHQIILPDYLAWWFRYNCDYGGFSALAGAKATIAHLPGAKLKQLQVAVPPMELQEQFAVFVAQTDKSKVAVRKY